MIFLTVGSDISFSRLTLEFDRWCRSHSEQHTFAQVGRLASGDHVPEATEWVELLSSGAFSKAVAKSKLIVAHAGMGSILTALSTGKPIVILPRTEKLRETRSDHQIATARRFENRNGIFVAWEEGELGARISDALEFQASQTMAEFSQFAPPAFTDRIRAFILGEADGNHAGGG